MRYFALCVAGLCLLAMNVAAGAEPTLTVGMSRAQAPMVLAQAEQPKKSETVTQKVKSVWRKLTGYKFDVACRNVFCGVLEAKS